MKKDKINNRRKLDTNHSTRTLINLPLLRWIKFLFP